MSKIKNGLFIGRFQVPTPHAGHRSVLSQAASQCEHLLILVGSANSCPSIKNPWSIRYRINSVRNMMHAQGFTNFTNFFSDFDSVNDLPERGANTSRNANAVKIERSFFIGVEYLSPGGSRNTNIPI